MNAVTLIGRLGQDPETSEAGSSTVTKFSLATSERWKDKEGNQQERTHWHNCEAWGRQGEVVQQYVKKGHQLAVVGSIQYDKYDKDGETRTYTKIKVARVELLSNSQSSDSSSNGGDDDIPF